MIFQASLLWLFLCSWNTAHRNLYSAIITKDYKWYHLTMILINDLLFWKIKSSDIVIIHSNWGRCCDALLSYLPGRKHLSIPPAARQSSTLNPLGRGSAQEWGISPFQGRLQPLIGCIWAYAGPATCPKQALQLLYRSSGVSGVNHTTPQFLPLPHPVSCWPPSLRQCGPQ